MTGSVARLSPALLAGAPLNAGAVPLRARLADRLEPELARTARWPWRLAVLAGAAHLALAALVLLVSRGHLPRPPPEPVAISVVSETTPQGANTPPMPSPQPAAPPSPVAELPPPPPPAPQNPRIPKPTARTARGAKIKAEKMASTTVAVTHQAVPFADNQAPYYPRSAIMAHEQGVVRFKLYLSADGRVRNFVLIQSSGYADLDASVRAAAMGWHYQPAMRRGVAVPSVVQFHVKFLPH
ncbi:MAG TPA: energy transducer TonB [Acidocella sp.]|nr:energy transducer TonB [Acidocella sp.]